MDGGACGRPESLCPGVTQLQQIGAEEEYSPVFPDLGNGFLFFFLNIFIY